MAGSKRAYSRVQEGPWMPVNREQKRPRVALTTHGASYTSLPWIRTNNLPVTPEEGTLIAATYTSDKCWESLPPALSTAPLYPRPINLPQCQAATSLPTRCISAPPSGPIPLSEPTRRSSLVETLVRPNPIRRDSAPTPFLPSLASATVPVCRTAFGDSYFSSSPTSGSGSTTSSITSQVSKFFSRTRSEIKYARTTLEHLEEQATFGMRLVNDNGFVIPYELGADAKPNPRRGRGVDVGVEGAEDVWMTRGKHEEVVGPIRFDIRGGSDSTLGSGIIPSSVREAARSLMSISSAVYHSTQTQGVRPDRIDITSTYASTKVSSTCSPGFKHGPPSNRVKIVAGVNTAATVPCNTPGYPILRDRQTASLFGPDARRLPSPNPSILRGHSGSHGLGAGSLTSANQLASGDGASVKPINVDSLSLAVDVFLGATTLAR
ncbi:hypothetical protein RHS01_00452 [Rhizoctonia solani]|uniref:Uncharacterized protein n=1 Tax=Rhizoctonia solani TaxID=456999 RepID=A0A8H7ILT8_9AGAM|nr:hypothetical protein RHS01_00452 [Rhizoctonia solani]